MKTKVAKGEKIVSRKPVKAESWAGLGAGTAALAVKAVGSGRDKETGGGGRARGRPGGEEAIRGPTFSELFRFIWRHRRFPSFSCTKLNN